MNPAGNEQEWEVEAVEKGFNKDDPFELRWQTGLFRCCLLAHTVDKV